MGLEGINTKWNKSERKTNAIWPHFYVESKEKRNKQTKTKLIDNRTDWWFPAMEVGVEDEGKMGKGGQKTQTSS